MSSASRPLFVYGTLRDADVLAAVLGRLDGQKTAIAASAPGYRAVFVPDRTYPALLADRTATAPGLLLKGLAQADVALLDFFEGEEYSRGAIEIIVSGEPVAADVYWSVVPVPADAPQWELEAWAGRYKAAFLAAETETIAQLHRRLSSLTR